jgi:hypothetical protein
MTLRNNNIRQPAARRKARLAKRLATYTAAATAAAATAVPDNEVHADVVYNDITDVILYESTPGPGIVGGFDLDNDGTIDLEFGMQQFSSGYGAVFAAPGEGFTDSLGATNNRIAGTAMGSYFYAQNVAFGTTIDSTLPSLSSLAAPAVGSLAYGIASSCPNCEFSAPTTGFVGVRFDSGGDMMYGWVRVHVDDGSLNTLTVMDYAYNDAGGSIQAGQVPEPGCLGLLALGGVGLVSWRRRRKNQEQVAS